MPAPQQSSTQLTVGTPDANARMANSSGHVRLDVVVGDPATPADEADVRLEAVVHGRAKRRHAHGLHRHLSAAVGLRITDKDNTPHPGGPGAATVSDTSLAFPVPCAVTADTTIGSTCAAITSADALAPGSVKERRRAIWQLGRVEVRDAADTPFLTHGLFIP